jgi:cell division protein FtsB
MGIQMKYSEVGRTQSRGWKLLRRCFFLIFTIVFWSGCIYQVLQLRADSEQYTQQIQALESQIDQEKEKQLDQKTGSQYYSTDEYKEQQARERFNLVKPGESLIVIK